MSSLALVTVLAAVMWAAAAGWRAAVVTGGSMRPGIQPGDVVVTVPAHHPGIGSVVTYRKPGRPMLHRIVGVDARGRLVTKGDANTVADAAPVPRDAVTGVARWRIPYAARPALWGTVAPAGLCLAWWVRSRRSGRRPS